MSASSSASHALFEEFLAHLVTELDDESVRAIILRGSYARGDATPPYSDIDLTRIIQETVGDTLPKRFFWRDGYLVSVSTYSYVTYQERLTHPEQAIFAVTGIREARILLDKDGAFNAFQQAAFAFSWQPLQSAANHYAGQKLLELTEIILRTMKVLQFPHEVLLSKMLVDIVADITEVMAVQQGVLVIGQNYYNQIQQSVGEDSLWTYYQRRAAGVPATTAFPLPLKERGVAALRLYQETFHILHSALYVEQREAIAPLISMMDEVLPHEKIG